MKTRSDSWKYLCPQTTSSCSAAVPYQETSFALGVPCLHLVLSWPSDRACLADASVFKAGCKVDTPNTEHPALQEAWEVLKFLNFCW